MEILDRIDWASVNWLYVAVLTALVFFSTLLGALLSFKTAPLFCQPYCLRQASYSGLLPAWFAAADISNRPEGAGLSPPQRTTLSAPMRSRRFYGDCCSVARGNQPAAETPSKG
jgi:hypothetical protein